MSDNKKNIPGHKSNTQLLGEMLAGVAKQQEINKRLKIYSHRVFKLTKPLNYSTWRDLVKLCMEKMLLITNSN